MPSVRRKRDRILINLSGLASASMGFSYVLEPSGCRHMLNQKHNSTSKIAGVDPNRPA